MINAIEKLEEIKRLAQLEIKNIQDSCEHLNVKGNYHSNTGNYDPSIDSYWWSGVCLDCKKYLHVDSDTPEYRIYQQRNTGE